MLILIINGPSGTGKTTAARTLAARIQNCSWVHPDERWDTPKMDAETILTLAAKEALLCDASQTVIIDCQVRPTAISRVLSMVGAGRWLHVMLTCPRAVREERLLQRGWTQESFAIVESWATILRAEAIAASDLVIDTSVNTTDDVCDQISSRHEELMRVGA